MDLAMTDHVPLSNASCMVGLGLFERSFPLTKSSSRPRRGPCQVNLGIPLSKQISLINLESVALIFGNTRALEEARSLFLMIMRARAQAPHASGNCLQMHFRRIHVGLEQFFLFRNQIATYSPSISMYECHVRSMFLFGSPNCNGNPSFCARS